MSFSSSGNDDIRKNLTSSFDSLSEAKIDTMKVFCRIRPMLPREEEAGYTNCIAPISDDVVRAVVPESSVKFKATEQEIYEDFKYSIAFGPEVGQFAFFQETITEIMTGFIEGQNGLIFSYGITNSGKTFTLQGDESNPGLITLACHLFFACIEKQMLEEPSVRPDKCSDLVVMSASDRAMQLQLKEELFRTCDLEDSRARTQRTTESKSFGMMLCDAFYDDFKFEERQTTLPPEEMMSAQSALYLKDLAKKSAATQTGFVSIWVSFIEIYNEYIYDLLQPNILQRQKLSLAEDQNSDVYVKGVKEICVSSCEEALMLLEIGRKNLRIASTKLNYQSSRSHCIYTLKVVRLYEDGEEAHGRVNRISFCDLAGSERASKSHTSGMRLKEAGYINTSLLVLGRCLEQLRLNQSARDKKMIPYRESKLTRLFYQFFAGKGKAAMIANASPCELTFDETLNVLRFSALAKELTLNDTYVSAASSSLQNLTSQWGKLKSRTVTDFSLDESSSDFDTSLSAEIKEKDEIIETLLELAENLRNNLKEEKQEKVQLEFKLRQEIYEDYSQYSDELLENQKKRNEEHLQCVQLNHQKNYNRMVEYYLEKIRLLEDQMDDETSCDESIMEEKRKSILEVDEKIASLEKNLESNSDELENYDNQSLASENESMKLKIAELNIEVEKITAQMKNYTDEIYNLKEELKNSAEKLKDSSEQKKEGVEQPIVEMYEKQISSLTEELQSLKTELEVTKEHLEQKTSQLEESKAAEEASKQHNNSLKLKMDEANQVLDQYKKDLETQKEKLAAKERGSIKSSEYIDKLEDEICTLKSKLEGTKFGFESRLAESTKAADRQKMLAEDLQEKLGDLQCNLDDTLRSLENYQEKCQVLTAEIQSYEKERLLLIEKSSALEKELNQFKTDAVEKMKQPAGDAVEIEKQKLAVEELTNKCNLLETGKAELTSKLDESAQLTENQKLTIKELEAQLSTLMAVKTELAVSLEESSSNHRQEIEELKNKYNNLESVRMELADLLDESKKVMESQNLVMEELKNKYCSLETELEVANKLLANEKNKVDDLSNKRASTETDLSKLKENNAKLLAELNNANNEDKLEASRLTSKIEFLEKLCVEHQAEKKELKNSVQELEGQMDTLRENLESERNKIQLLQDEVKKLKEDNSLSVSKMQKSQDLFNKKTEELKETLRAALDEKENLKKESSQLQSDLESSLKHRDEMDLKYKELKQTLQASLDKNSQLQKDLAALQADLKESKLEEELQSLKAELEVTKEHLEQKTSQLEESKTDSKVECEALREEVKQAEKQHLSSLSKLQKAEALALKQIEKLKENLETSKDENLALEKELKELKDKLKSSLDHQGEIVDLKRQVREKEASIEQLEQAIKDSQKLRNDNEAKHENQVESLEPKTKKAKGGRKPRATTSKEETNESDAVTTKRRRPFTSKQVKPPIEMQDETEDKEDPKPVRTTRRKRKSDDDFEPVKRTNRRKIEEDTTENMSPVQKAVSYVNTKLRNIAQSISAAPSPRMTRGRKKLFNNDLSTENPKWKL